MAHNRFYTLLLIPEKTDKIRKLILPSWTIRAFTLFSVLILILFGVIMVDYRYVSGQIDENKRLQAENRKLRQNVQVAQDRLQSIENSMDRVRTLSNRLKILTHIEDREPFLQSLSNHSPPDATVSLKPVPSPPSTTHRFLELTEQALNQVFSTVQAQAQELEQGLELQVEQLADKKAFLSALPTRRPAVGHLTSGFGVRRSPYGDRDKMHEGLDIANYPGTPVKSTADGVVRHAAARPGYGQTVILDHGYGLETWYAHCNRILVKPGQIIKRGEPIALLGNTGRSTGPHLHYEVRVYGTPVDPRTYILEN